ncbi:hypothetical protein [Tahibacter aquaticus]|uniref:hypothetical protein n=1 Tax=Tahibacter aquaticus TaxID=520092 RepID=UPI001414CF5A|nr:hypothetical protein [Tahibacter aquaticus]
MSVGLLALVLTGCAAWREPPPTHRLGWVKAVIDGAAIQNPADHACVASLSAADIAGQRWVVVGVRQGRYRRLHTVALPDALAVEPGDRVLIDPANCDVPLRRAD